jgi:hypothetical protein
MHCLADFLSRDPVVEVHVIGHSAGNIFHAPLIQFLATRGKIKRGKM